MRLNLTINTLFLSLLGLFVGYNVLQYYLTPSNVYQPPIGALPVPIQAGKSKIYVSKERDASMRTEYLRRRTIIGSNSGPDKKFGFSGSTNGSLETFFLSSVLPTRLARSLFEENFILDGGSATNVGTLILDGNGSATTGSNSSNIFVDGGNAYTIY
jgi:hypothetical protein